MNTKLSTLFNKIKAKSDLLTVSEAQTSQGIVLPILHNLGWDIFDTNEVIPEFSVGGKRVDYALRIIDLNKVFLEIKKTSEDLEKHQEQLVYYAFQQGVKLAILTNGVTWWFYLPLEEGGWEHRKFFTIDLMEQSVEDAVEKFEKLLIKTKIENGTAYKNAKSLYDGKQKSKIIKENLPKAWEKLITEPDEMLVELLNDTLEKISGYKANNNQIIRFLEQTFPNTNINIAPLLKPTPAKVNKIENDLDTIVVPAQDEGFQKEFLGNNCWFAIRLNAKKIPNIKYLATYRVAPVSAITHIAEVSKIEKYKDTDKYILYFKEKAKKIEKVKIGKDIGKVPQASRYSARVKILNAKSLDDVF